jgi:hypothetical protein
VGGSGRRGRDRGDAGEGVFFDRASGEQVGEVDRTSACLGHRGDHGGVDPAAQEVHRAGVPEAVRAELPALQRRASCGRGPRRGGDPPLDRVAAQAPAGAGREDGSPGRPRRSISHRRRAPPNGAVNGTALCLRPLRSHRRCAPVPGMTSPRSKLSTSEIRSPVWIATSRRVWSRWPCQVVRVWCGQVAVTSRSSKNNTLVLSKRFGGIASLQLGAQDAAKWRM